MFPLRVYTPTIGLPVVNWALLAINFTVFFYLLALPGDRADEVMLAYGAAPVEIWVGKHLWGLVTGMFVHNVGRLVHIVFNMLALAIFGGNVEGELGHLRYLVLYLLGGVVAALTHIAILHDQTKALVGASGAVSAVMGAYLVIYPRRTVLFFAPFLGLMRQPVLIYMIVWLAAQIVVGLWSGNNQIAWFAHVGGFAAGVALVKSLRMSKDRAPASGGS